MNRGYFETEYRYVDDVLSINNSYFHSYVKSLRVKAKYRKIPQILRHLFYICVFTKIKTLMVTYKQHYLINVMILFFSIVNFPCLCSIYHHHLLIGFMSLSLLVMKVHALHINNFLNKASY